MLKTILTAILLSLSLSLYAEEVVNLKGVEDIVLKDMTEGGKKYLCMNAIKGEKIKIKLNETTGRIVAVIKCEDTVWVADRAGE